MKDLYTKHYKTWMKEIEKDTNKWKDTPYSWTRRTDVKMYLLLKVIYRFNVIPVKIPMAFFTEIEQSFLICGEPQKTVNSQSNLGKKNSGRGITLPDFKLY